jgi:hypothetical protein
MPIDAAQKTSIQETLEIVVQKIQAQEKTAMLTDAI